MCKSQNLMVYNGDNDTQQCLPISLIICRDLSSVQSILMEHFITDIMGLCDKNSKESVLEEYLLSQHGTLLLQTLSLLTIQVRLEDIMFCISFL
jgi:hypothetical protein